MPNHNRKTHSRAILSTSMVLACCAAFSAQAARHEPTSPAESTNATAVARFDAAIAQGLPARLQLTGLRSGQTRGDDDLHIEGRLEGDVVFADGTHGVTYDGMWRGTRAVVTRSRGHLDITSVTRSGIDITGYTEGSDEVEHEALAGDPRDRSARTAVKASPPAPPATPDAAEELKPNRLTFHLMLHDDTRGTYSHHIHAGYVAWWLADFQRRIAPGRVVDVLYSRDIAGVTDVRYGYLGTLHDWSDAMERYASERDIPRTYRHKFLLVTKGMVEPDRHGRSWQKGFDGMASLDGRYSEVAHQLGHLLGAKHERAEVRYQGWWCETNMYAPSLVLRSNCYVYSRANMSLIDDYVRTGEGFIGHSRWSED